MRKLTIYWPSHTSRELEKTIRMRFGITAGTTINGETPAVISDEDMPVLEDTARRGFIEIRKYKQVLEHLLTNRHVQNT